MSNKTRVDPLTGFMENWIDIYGDGSVFAREVATGPGAGGGSSGGITAFANFTPAAAAYSAGDVISVAQQFSWIDRSGLAVPAGSLIRVLTAIAKIDETALISGETSYTLQLYSVTPPSAQADNDAWTLASADLPSYQGAINLGTPVDLGASAYIKSQYIDTDIKLTTSGMFGELVTVGGFTATAVARQILLYGVPL